MPSMNEEVLTSVDINEELDKYKKTLEFMKKIEI